MQIQDTLTPYVSSLLEGMPKVAKLPLFDYGSAGAVGFYELQLKEVMSYKDLQTEVFHSFREVGNAFVIFRLFEETLNMEEVLDLSYSKPFCGDIPVNARDGEDRQAKRDIIMRAAAPMFYMDHVTRRGTPAQQALASTADTLTKERLCIGLSIFQSLLVKVKQMLRECDREHNVWFGPPPPQGIVDIDECNQFHRLWSAIIYTSNRASAMRGADQTL